MHPEKFEVDKIQNGRLSAIERPDIVEYHENQDIYTITIKQIVRLQERVLKKITLTTFKLFALMSTLLFDLRGFTFALLTIKHV